MRHSLDTRYMMSNYQTWKKRESDKYSERLKQGMENKLDINYNPKNGTTHNKVPHNTLIKDNARSDTMVNFIVFKQ